MPDPVHTPHAGIVLARLRAQYRVTLADLARAAHLSVPYVSDICRARRGLINRPTIAALAGGFGEHARHARRCIELAALQHAEGLMVCGCTAEQAQRIVDVLDEGLLHRPGDCSVV